MIDGFIALDTVGDPADVFVLPAGHVNESANVVACRSSTIGVGLFDGVAKVEYAGGVGRVVDDADVFISCGTVGMPARLDTELEEACVVVFIRACGPHIFTEGGFLHSGNKPNELAFCAQIEVAGDFHDDGRVL